MYTVCIPGAFGGQKRASDPMEWEFTDNCELSHGHWQSNSDALARAKVLGTTEPSFLPRRFGFREHLETMFIQQKDRSRSLAGAHKAPPPRDLGQIYTTRHYF